MKIIANYLFTQVRLEKALSDKEVEIRMAHEGVQALQKTNLRQLKKYQHLQKVNSSLTRDIQDHKNNVSTGLVKYSNEKSLLTMRCYILCAF